MSSPPSDGSPSDGVPGDGAPGDGGPIDGDGDGDGGGDGGGEDDGIGGCLADGALITMADGALRAIDAVRAGEEILVIDLSSGKLSPEPVVRTHSKFVPRTVVIECADGSVLQVSPRQPVVLHDGRSVTAFEIHRWMQSTNHEATQDPGGARRKAHFVPAVRADNVQLRTLGGDPLKVVAANVSQRRRRVYWLEIRTRRHMLAMRLQIVLPVMKE